MSSPHLRVLPIITVLSKCYTQITVSNNIHEVTQIGVYQVIGSLYSKTLQLTNIESFGYKYESLIVSFNQRQLKNHLFSYRHQVMELCAF